MNVATIEHTALREGEFILAQPGEPIINITSFTARQKVSGYVGDQISHLMGGDEPTLIWAKDRMVWRVPITLSMPSRGVIGVVGLMDVDTRTGHLIIPKDFAKQVEIRAQALTSNSSL
jgi:hypothetical protein